MQKIEELVAEVARTGMLDLHEEKIIEYQDMIGHASCEENQELANDMRYRDSYYRVYGAAYGIVAAINYYANNDSRNVGLRESLVDQEKEIEELKKELGFIREERNKFEAQLKEIRRDMEGTEASLNEAREENVRLKAKLYDLTRRD